MDIFEGGDWNKKHALRHLDSVSLLNTAKFKLENEQDEEESEIDELFVNNAGLVIVSTFLPRLFERLGYLEEGVFRDKTSAKRAIHVLEYLVIGGEEYEEIHLPLNKILCGLDINEVVNNDFQITEAEKEECESLLKAVINNWSVLKNTSIEGLRTSFIQRKGKLTKNEDNWNLLVERKTFDVLIN